MKPTNPQEVWARIEKVHAALPGLKPIMLVTPEPMRNRPRKEIAAAVRHLLKRLDISGVSVKTPQYSMAQAIDIRVPWTPQEFPDDVNWREVRGSFDAARSKLRAIILHFYPDLDDRSDSMSDYFDYRLSIH